MIASATFKDGENAGMPVPIHCTWYNSDQKSGSFVQIPDVSGSCFQPSVEDIGFKVVVHAIPASDIREYQGMPLFKEIGPLKMDPKVASTVSKLSQKNPVEFTSVFLESVEHPEISFGKKEARAATLRV